LKLLQTDFDVNQIDEITAEPEKVGTLIDLNEIGTEAKPVKPSWIEELGSIVYCFNLFSFIILLNTDTISIT